MNDLLRMEIYTGQTKTARIGHQYAIQILTKTSDVAESAHQKRPFIDIAPSPRSERLERLVYRTFHSRGLHLCKFIETKESVCIRKEFNSHRICLGHQYGRRDVMRNLRLG